jgi:hypothetical protein
MDRIGGGEVGGLVGGAASSPRLITRLAGDWAERGPAQHPPSSASSLAPAEFSTRETSSLA